MTFSDVYDENSFSAAILNNNLVIVPFGKVPSCLWNTEVSDQSVHSCNLFGRFPLALVLI